MRYTKKELEQIFISILVITFVFVWARLGVLNFLAVFLMVAITFFVHDLAHKFVAEKYGASSQYRIWTVERIAFYKTRTRIKPFPLGIILAVFVALFSAGTWFFTAVESFVLETKRHKRVGKKFLELTEAEIALIALSGPLANILLAYFLKIFGFFDEMILINSLFAVFHMLPFSSLDGAKVFFGAKYLYILGLFFILFSAVALQFLSSVEGFLLSIILAVFGMVVFFLIYNKKFF